MKIAVNLNDYVYVKITESGKRFIIDEYGKEYYDICILPHTDNDGYTEMQLHEVMLLFGEQMYNGNNKLPIENTLFYKKIL